MSDEGQSVKITRLNSYGILLLPEEVIGEELALLQLGEQTYGLTKEQVGALALSFQEIAKEGEWDLEALKELARESMKTGYLDPEWTEPFNKLTKGMTVRVRVTPIAGKETEWTNALVVIAAENQRSLFLHAEHMLAGHVQGLPLAYDDTDGTYRSIIDGTSFDILPMPEIGPEIHE